MWVFSWLIFDDNQKILELDIKGYLFSNNCKIRVKNIWLGDQLLEILIFKTLYFLKMCPIHTYMQGQLSQSVIFDGNKKKLKFAYKLWH